MTGSQLGATALTVVWLSAVCAQTAQVRDAILDVQVPAPPTIAVIDGQPQLVYELHVTNFGRAAVTLTRIDVLGGHASLHSTAATDLAGSLARVGERPRASDPQQLEPGRRSIFYVWLPLPRSEMLSEIRHRISFRTVEGSEQSVDAADARIARDPPIALGPPLRGGPWVAVYDPSLPNGHRRTLFAVGGKARIPARFAVDWMKLGPDGRFSHDDPAVLSNSFSYGEDVLAVADALVSAVEHSVPEPTPNISVGNEAGNYVALDLGGNRFAFYEHLKPGSIRVKPHERVRAGQILAEVGASGSVFSGAHLHFHVADANSPLAAEGLPFALRTYQRVGAFPSFEALARPWQGPDREAPTTRSMDLPAPLTVVRFD